METNSTLSENSTGSKSLPETFAFLESEPGLQHFVEVWKAGQLPKAEWSHAAHVAMAWVAGSPNRNVPIVGAGKPAQLEVAVEALSVALGAADRAFLEAPYRPRDEINDYNPVRRPRALYQD